MNFSCDNMNSDYAKEVMKEMKNNKANKCTLIGGEPTLHPGIVDLIKYGKQIGLSMKIVTNGRMLSNENFLRRIKEAGISIIAISIHSYKPTTHNKITKNKSFGETVQGIKNCLKEDINLFTLTTINKLNKNDVFGTANFLNELGVKNIVFNIAAPDMNGGLITRFVLSPREIAKIIEKNYKLLKKEGIKAEFYATTPLCLYNKRIIGNMIKDSYLMLISNGGCNIFDGSGFGFDPWGNLIPCTHMVDEKLLKTMDEKGNFLYKGKFPELWRKIEKRFGIKNWKYPSKSCLNCLRKRECIGGCPLFWKSFKPDNYIKGPI